MNLIVAVYDDWGIGADGTQPVSLRADRKFFRETTRGATVIVGRRTLADFPGGRPLPGRRNLVLSGQALEIPGAEVVHSPEEAAAAAGESAFVIGGGSVYRQFLPLCRTAYVTRVHTTPASDTFFPNLDASPQWVLETVLETGEEQGIGYEICRYQRK